MNINNSRFVSIRLDLMIASFNMLAAAGCALVASLVVDGTTALMSIMLINVLLGLMLLRNAYRKIAEIQATVLEQQQKTPPASPSA